MINVVVPLIIAGLLPFVLTGLTKAKGFSGRDNHRTREWQATLDGWRKRAYWAHLNALETLPHFIAAVLCAHLAQPHSTLAAAFAWGYIGLRIAYSVFYIDDRAPLRSLSWLMSMGAIIGLFVVALTA